MQKNDMPQINYAEKLIKKGIDDRLKRYHLKIIKACAESPAALNIHFIKKVELLKEDILDTYGEKSDYVRACDKLLSQCKSCDIKKEVKE